MLISDLDYDLPPEQIAQYPLPDREASHLLLLDRVSGAYEDRGFAQLPELLLGNELVILNNAKVIPARLFGQRKGTMAEPIGRHSPIQRDYLKSRIEVLLLRRVEGEIWEALVKPGRKLRTGEWIVFEGGELEAEIVGRGELGVRRLRFHGRGDVWAAIERIGHMPLPPYIRRPDSAADKERYQTVFAARPGAVAAPTAGLHFTPAILEKLRFRGVEIRELTLDVGLGTFQPIHGEEVEQHKIHCENYEIPESTAAAIAKAKRGGRPVLAVGTTVVRALEDAAQKTAAGSGQDVTLSAGRATAEIFIRPGHCFRVVDQLLTNFHLPRSTLLVLVAAFAGRENALSAYRHAVSGGYRFYSYGDCMLIR